MIQFQPPQLDPDLSRQLDAELAKTGMLPGGLSGDESFVGDSRGASGDGGVSPSVFAACQCHACLKQSGHMISTSLPVQVVFFCFFLDYLFFIRLLDMHIMK